MSYRVLVTGGTHAGDEALRTELTAVDPETIILPEPFTNSTIEMIARGEFDSVVCRAEESEAIRQVSEIRRINALVPIVVVAPGDDPGLAERVLSAGATSLVRADLVASVVAENVAHVLRLKRASFELAGNLKRARELYREVRELRLERMVIAQAKGRTSDEWLRRGLLPLLVENDPEEAFQMVRALEKAEVFAPLPIMKTAPEAISYLAGDPPYSSRTVYPLPGAVLADLEPAADALPLLRWIRSRPDLSGMVVIVLGRSSAPAEGRETYDRLANSYLVKPEGFEELVGLVRMLDHYWTKINFGRYG